MGCAAPKLRDQGDAYPCSNAHYGSGRWRKGEDSVAWVTYAAQYGLRSGESCCPELQSGQGSHEDEDNRSPYCATRQVKGRDMGLGQGELGSLDAVRAGVPDPTPKPMSPRFMDHQRATMAKSITPTRNEREKHTTRMWRSRNALKLKR